MSKKDIIEILLILIGWTVLYFVQFRMNNNTIIDLKRRVDRLERIVLDRSRREQAQDYLLPK